MTYDIDALLAAAEAFATDDEVVTHAHLRPVPLLDGTGSRVGTMGLITLDNGLDHTRPNTFGPRGLIELNAALDGAFADDAVTCLGIVGKPFILAAGADLTALAELGPEHVGTIAQLGHAVFSKLHADRAGGKPTFGFINGLALGGGLEVALHCTYRTVLDTAAAIGLPEVGLGLVPGWGGAYLVPNLIGPSSAARVILENPLSQGRTLTGAQAFDIGLADASFPGASYLEDSLCWAADVLSGAVEVRRPHVDHGPMWDLVVATARSSVTERTGGASPAALRALDLIALAKDGDAEASFAAEDDALHDMAATPELAASLYAFNLVQRRAKHPVGAPDKSLARPVTKVGVVGAGLMAAQLALLLVRRLKVPVVLTDLDQTRADKGVAWVRGEIDTLLGKGRLSPDAANRLKALVTGTTDQAAAFGDADLVIEAVFEDLEVKRQVFAQVERVVRTDTVLATNTSSLSVGAMAADLAHPERVVGMHFFNPVAVMPLVEIARTTSTDDSTAATALTVAKGLRKTAILVGDSTSFVVNRLLGRLMSETSLITEDGTPQSVIDAAFAGVTPLPPSQLLVLVGPAIAQHNAESLHAAFGDRFHVPGTRPVEQGLEGPSVATEGEARSHEERQRRSTTTLTPADVRHRVLTAMADEVRCILAEGVVSAVEDLDLAMITGAGFPLWNGGLTPLLQREGLLPR